MTAVMEAPAVDEGGQSFTANRSSDAAAIALIEALHRKNYRFITVTPATHALVDRREGNPVARDLRDIFGWSRAFSADTIDAEIFQLLRDGDFLEREGELWRSRIRVSSLGTGLVMHSAFPTSAADSVFFGPDTYRFVATIEQHLRSNVASRSSVRRAIDIGCGAGPGAITIAAAHPDAEVFAIDINDAALRLTAINAAAASLSNVIPRRSNLLGDVDGEFDLIVANPPYLIDAGARTYRHGGGQFGEALSVQIVEAALPRLAAAGSLVLYTGVAIVGGDDPFLTCVQPLLENASVTWSYREIDPDIFAEELSTPPYRHAERIAATCLVAMRS